MIRTALLSLLLSIVATASPPSIQGIGIEQRLNASIPLETQFHDEHGNTVRLGNYFGRKPILLAPVYFTCPMLCSQVLSGVVAGLRPLSLRPGRDFDVIAISFDPSDTPQKAAEEQLHYSTSYSSRRGTAGWHFLTGNQQSITAVMSALGFHYRWDAKNKMFVHASGIMLLTPQGKLSRYLYGVEYEPKDLKLALIESSHDKIGSLADQFLLLCYHYDPKTGKYGPLVIGMLQISAILTVLLMATGLIVLWRHDLRQHARPS